MNPILIIPSPGGGAAVAFAASIVARHPSGRPLVLARRGIIPTVLPFSPTP